MASGLSKINHVVVLMFENRSFDNLLGWLYDGGTPKRFLPVTDRAPYNGLIAGKYFNTSPQTSPTTIYATKPAQSYWVPSPDPNEQFDRMTDQIFGTPPAQVANMSGFLADYVKQAGVSLGPLIMETYSPAQVNVLSTLARSFAVSDAWFASAPCQTWPNRAFVHTGTSDGHVNNFPYTPGNLDTIFNALERNGVSWGVFKAVADPYPSLTHYQFLPKLFAYPGHFQHFSLFQTLCGGRTPGRLPAYSFVEPKLYDDSHVSNDYHPPSNLCAGEHFLAEVYQTIAGSPYRDEILFVVTFDEHGGCYDHVPPPTGAAAPAPLRHGDFTFTRFGVRVPAIVISSWVEPGTVFRAPASGAPYDHTSILATLRDWKGLANNPGTFLPSPRIAKAPTLEPLLTISDPTKKTAWPTIAATCTEGSVPVPPDTALSDLQVSLLVAAESMKRGGYVGEARAAEIQRTVRTHADARAFGARLR